MPMASRSRRPPGIGDPPQAEEAEEADEDDSALVLEAIRFMLEMKGISPERRREVAELKASMDRFNTRIQPAE